MRLTLLRKGCAILAGLFILTLFQVRTAGAVKPADFDGDGVTDLAVWRPSTGTWFIRTTQSVNTHTCPPCFTYYAAYDLCQAQWGLPGDTPRPADFDGDNKVDLAVWRPSTQTWWIQSSAFSCYAYQITFGGVIQATDRPEAADVTGDSRADIMMFRRGLDPKWFIRDSTTQVVKSFQAYHPSSYVVSEFPYVNVSAKYLQQGGSAFTDGARFENASPPNGNKVWTVTSFINYQNPAAFSVNSADISSPQDANEVATRGQWGGSPVNQWDYVRFNTANNFWTIRYAINGSYSWFQFGLPGDKPLSGDYDGDSLADAAVWRPAEGRFYVRINGPCPSGMTHNGAPADVCWSQLGLFSDMPIESLVDMSRNY